MNRLREYGRALGRAVSWHRRLVAAALAAVAVAASLSAAAPAAPATTPVLTAAKDLAGGAVLAPGDVSTVRLPPTVVPTGALRPGVAVAGRRLAGPVRRGEPLTDVRLLGPALLAMLDQPGRLAVPVRVADAAVAALVRAGDSVDVLAGAAAPGEEPAAENGGGNDPGGAVATGVRVLATPAEDDAADEGALIVVAADPAQAVRLARAGSAAPLSVGIRPQP